MRTAHRSVVVAIMAVMGAIIVGVASSVTAPPADAEDVLPVTGADTPDSHFRAAHSESAHHHHHAGSDSLGWPTRTSPTVGSDFGLTAKTIAVKNMIVGSFPQITEIGGFRAHDPYPDHPSGLAIDVMVPQWWTVRGMHLGDLITSRALSEPDVDYVLWRQQYITRDGALPMADRGSPTQNHMDHVHIKTDGPLRFPIANAIVGVPDGFGADLLPDLARDLDLDLDTEPVEKDEPLRTVGDPGILRVLGAGPGFPAPRRAAPVAQPVRAVAVAPDVSGFVEPIVEFLEPIVRSRPGRDDGQVSQADEPDEIRPAVVDSVDIDLSREVSELVDLAEADLADTADAQGAESDVATAAASTTATKPLSSRKVQPQIRKSADFSISSGSAVGDQEQSTLGQAAPLSKPSSVTVGGTSDSDSLSSAGVGSIIRTPASVSTRASTLTGSSIGSSSSTSSPGKAISKVAGTDAG